ncbi:MAG: hypothetical protein DRP16_02965 [Candidatus Aenigmatarchaeota archaeon]|nr:MAG: hypothetical protein DRP16_02965 [Candidatus Aenigmarchaeota archaeon]
MNRVSTGITRLDKLTGGGFPKETVILLSGGAGTGKTLLGLNFLLEGAKKGEKCCYVSLSETQDELLRAAKGIKSLNDIKKYLGKNLVIEHIPLGENITLKKFVEIIGMYPKIDRLVIDNVNKLLIFAENKNLYRVYLTELVNHLKEMGSTLLICETKEEQIDSGNNEAFECDGVINLSFLDLEEKPTRTLQITKMRYTIFEPRIRHELIINEKGIALKETKII